MASHILKFLLEIDVPIVVVMIVFLFLVGFSLIKFTKIEIPACVTIKIMYCLGILVLVGFIILCYQAIAWYLGDNSIKMPSRPEIENSESKNNNVLPKTTSEPIIPISNDSAASTTEPSSLETTRVSNIETLVDKTVPLFVDVFPDNAIVKIVNIKPKYHAGILLSPGKYSISASLDGYITKQKWIVIDSDDVQKKVKIELEKTEEIIHDDGVVIAEPFTYKVQDAEKIGSKLKEKTVGSETSTATSTAGMDDKDSEQKTEKVRPEVAAIIAATNGMYGFDKIAALSAIKSSIPPALSGEELSLLINTSYGFDRLSLLNIVLIKCEPSSIDASTIPGIIKNSQSHDKAKMLVALAPHVKSPILADEVKVILNGMYSDDKYTALVALSPKIERPINDEKMGKIVYGMNGSDIVKILKCLVSGN